MPPYSFRRQCQAYERLAETARIEFSYFALPSFLAWRLLPYGLSVMSCPVFEPLAEDAFYGPRGTLHVIYAEPDAIGIAKVELCQITVQMLLLAMLVNTFHAALEDRIIAFHGIGVDDATYIFVSRMIDGLVHPILIAKLVVSGQFVAHYEGFLRDIGADNRKKMA